MKCRGREQSLVLQMKDPAQNERKGDLPKVAKEECVFARN